jgi:hypothetical protein
MMLALMRSGTWEWALFFHVLGALLLIGSMIVVVAAAVGAARGNRPDGALELRRLTWKTLVLLVLPSFILMRGTAEWVRSEDGFADDATWISVGYIVTDAGVIVMLALLFLGWRSARSAARGELRAVSGRILSVLAPLYLVALLVAMWAMTTKPD